MTRSGVHAPGLLSGACQLTTRPPSEATPAHGSEVYWASWLPASTRAPANVYPLWGGGSHPAYLLLSRQGSGGRAKIQKVTLLASSLEPRWLQK